MTAGQGAWSDATVTAALNMPDRAPAKASAQLLITKAETGAKPVLAVADNRQRYWLKWAGNPHGNLSLVHEVVVAGIGRLPMVLAGNSRRTALQS